MNADISCWSTRWHGVEEYPHRYATLRAHSLIKSKVFTDADLHMIAERTGDVMCYLFFRQAPDGCRSGITLCVNGYACRNLDRLALLAAPVVDALSDFVLGEGDDARTETFIAERLGELREKLEAATDLGESELSPIDYAIKDDNYISYAWGYADPKAILSSSEQGLTYVRFPGIATPTLLSTAPKVKSSRSSFFGEGRVVFLVIVLLISSLLVTVYFNNRYQKEKDLRISAQDELSALQYESGKMDSRAEELKAEIDRKAAEAIKAEIDRKAAEANKLRQKQEELDQAEETRSAPQATEYPRESQTTATTPSQPAWTEPRSTSQATEYPEQSQRSATTPSQPVWTDRTATAGTPSAPARKVHQKASSAFEITKVEIANINRSGALLTWFNEPIDAAEAMYLGPRITIKSKTNFSGRYTFRLKFKHHDWDDSYSRLLYDKSEEIDLACTKGEIRLLYINGTGDSQRGTWPEGVYNLEIWSDGQWLYTHTFGLY